MPKHHGLSRTVVLVLSSLALAATTFAVETTVWQQDDSSDFTSGAIKNLSVRSDGQLALAPSFRQLADLSTPYLWAVIQDSKGTLYCAGGAPTGATAEVFAITPEGKSRKFAQIEGLEIHAMAVDRQDRIYAATSPDSKIYRIGRDGQPQLFFDTKAKYVWAMAFDSSGNLYVATGDQGIIYRIAPDGKGTEFFHTEEAHARSMIIASNGDLIVGTEPGGYILRITPGGKSFVLFQTEKREVTAVAEHDGKFYAAAAGARPSKQPSVPKPSVQAVAPAPGGLRVTVAGQPATQQTHPAAPSQPPPSLQTRSAAIGGSDFYRIEPDGFAEQLWSSPDEIVYAIAFDQQGRPILGTGNHGMVYRVDSATMATRLVNAPPTQITGFLKGRNGILYAVTGNVGQLYAMGPGYEKSGSVESEVLDAGSFAYWGKAHLTAELHGGKAEIDTRSGNVNRPQKNWSDWTKVDVTAAGGQVSSVPARFLQYRLTLSAASDGKTPDVNAVQIAYLPKNVAPVVQAIEIEDPNYKASATPNFLERKTVASGSPASITVPALGARRNAPTFSPSSASGLTLQYDKGYITARWSAKDENDDLLEYRIELRGEGESVWRLLKDKLLDSHYSFDGSAFADGKYRLRITASDAPSNTPGNALTSSLVSDPFLIDNTPPQITSQGQTEESGKAVVRFTAKDTLSWIAKAEYSVNGGDWTLLDPTNRVSDSQQLNYELRLARPASQQVVAVRVFDNSDNETVARFVLGPRQ
ncbi:MAG TPA: hypothetical protein VN633_23160 [Bryobacteraceae bacterium]|nr:hypothetical protein [Bryobacteraceae bacterium]